MSYLSGTNVLDQKRRRVEVDATSEPEKRQSRKNVIFMCVVGCLLILSPFMLLTNTRPQFIVLIGDSNTSQIYATQASMRTVKQTIDTHSLQYGSYPVSLHALMVATPRKAALIQPSSDLDAWNNPLMYQVNIGNATRPYELISFGPDGLLNTADDIDLWLIP